MAQQVLKHLVHVQDRRVTMDSIQKAVAEKFQVSYETARSQLRSVYAKTDTHRQGQLVALLSGPPHQ